MALQVIRSRPGTGDAFMIVLFTPDKEKYSQLRADLVPVGQPVYQASTGEEFARSLVSDPQLVMVDVRGGTWNHDRALEFSTNAPVLALLTEECLSNGNSDSYDDFIVEPIRKSELVLRVTRLLHLNDKPEEGRLLVSGDLTIDLEERQVKVGQRRVDLVFREYELLRYLVTHPGKVLSRGKLLAEVWSASYYGGERTVDVHVRKLRSKLEDAEHSFIQTVRNVGYRFKPS